MVIDDLACPNCGGDLRFIEPYGRHYCHDCGQYAPEGFGGGKGLTCPTCGGVLSYIPEYDRYYCHRDAKYVEDESAPAAPTAPATAVAPELDEFDAFLEKLDPPPPSTEPAEVPPASEADAAAERGPQGATPEAPPDAEPVAPVELAPQSAPPSAPAEPVAPAPSSGAEPSPVVTKPKPGETPRSAAPPIVPLLLPRLRRASGKDATPPPPTPTPAKELPPLSRASLWKAKKSVLEQLCTDYGLSGKGSRETLRDRLMKKLPEIEAARARADAEAPPPVGPSAEPQVDRSAEPTPEALPATPETPREELEGFEAPSAEPGATAAGMEAQGATEEATVLAPRAAEDAKLAATPGEPSREATLAMVGPHEVSTPTTRPELEAQAPADVTPVSGELTVVKPVAVVERPKPPGAARPEPAAAAAPTPTAGPAVVIPPGPPRIEPAMPTTPARAVPTVVAPEMAKVAAPTAAPPPTPAAPTVPTCPTCGRALAFIADFSRHYCYSCKKYVPIAGGATRVAPEARVDAGKAAKSLCSTCGGELRYITQYDRYYCDACGKYAARRARRPCPTCGADLSWVGRYRRYYCTACLRYAPATFPPPAAATVVAAPAAAAAATRVAAAVTEAASTIRPESAHRHVNATVPLGIALVGFVLYALSTTLLLFSAQLGLPSSVTPTPSVSYLIGFFGVLLSMAGTIWGLWALNARR